MYKEIISTAEFEEECRPPFHLRFIEGQLIVSLGLYFSSKREMKSHYFPHSRPFQCNPITIALTTLFTKR